MITLKNMEKTQTKSKITKNYVKTKTLLNVEFLSFYLLEYELFFCINFTRKIEKYFKNEIH
jgi:outer membrane phospholipase A